MYPDTNLLIGDAWVPGAARHTIAVRNPATGAVIGQLAQADRADLAAAVAAAQSGFAVWRQVPASERATILRRGAALLRERVEAIAPLITFEQGKPLAQSRAEVLFAAEVTEWFAEEARRTYGRIIPARGAHVSAQAVPEALGVIAGLTPWNYPVGQAVRKVAIALAAGCSIILKVAEETPASAAAMVAAFVDAGLPTGALQLVFGNPAEVSAFLIAHPDVRGISFTGSTAVGKKLSALAGSYLKRCVMELGGHAPAIVFADADLDDAVATLAGDKFHNAGQACISPTRLLVESSVHGHFVDSFAAAARAIRMGDGFDPQTTMGPLANERRVTALTELVQDAVAQGARLVTGGVPERNQGYFFPPTVLSDVPIAARIMNEEPFGPVAIVNRFDTIGEAIGEANRLDYALAAYGFSTVAGNLHAMTQGVRSGMLSLNHNGLGWPEVPFAGIRDSGYGDEGGIEALREMMTTRFVSTRQVA
ncbi:NAD-dependent succinate-semialdehyde dehydrogenase [Devosia sp. FKR38]|uniref:NAD-dependent succinate-semialdehyde dehydrogenase n=1 Tax=Devosia sp. FKR38 TaxID=2562312 RepID=UPI0020BEC501|nr:NAD-dependent succinate-semialdehyde dehydrogenase [Devosia sp. FKR38]